MEQHRARDDEHHEGRDLQDDEHVVRRSRLSDPEESNTRAQHEERRRRRRTASARGRMCHGCHQVAVMSKCERLRPRGVPFRPLEHACKRGGELLRDRRRADPVLEDQREADDPRDELDRALHTRTCTRCPRSAPSRPVPHSTAPRRTTQAGEQIRDDDRGTRAFDAGPDGGEDAAADHRAETDRDQVLGRERAAQPTCSC